MAGSSAGDNVHPNVKAAVTIRDGNITDAAVLASAPGMFIIQVSTTQKRPSVLALILQPMTGGEGLGDEIEFSGLPFEPRLSFGETGRYGVYIALVQVAEDSEPAPIEITRLAAIPENLHPLNS
ncbi:MAG TPA: hypothetical protein VM510_14595 [Caulifigura sp.]|nr:hypothetical protein [Caulifigura sp.]